MRSGRRPRLLATSDGRPMTIDVVIPAVLAALADGHTTVRHEAPHAITVAELFDALGADRPMLNRRIRNETGALRRHVNVFIDGTNVRDLSGMATHVSPGQEVLVIQSIAGG